MHLECVFLWINRQLNQRPVHTMGYFNKAAFVLLAAIGLLYLRAWMRPQVPTDVKGFCLPQFAKVKDTFRKNLESGVERGGSFAVYHKGELVCDLWGGFADEYIEYPWQQNTVSAFFSATKVVPAFCLMILADRGLLDFDKPVAQYWPEFAQNGKENITIKMLVSHQAGLAAIDEKYSIRLVKTDPDEIGRILAAQKPNWAPGTAMGYHGMTYGLLLDQVLRRVDKKHRWIDQFFREEIAIPFDIDFSIGLPKEEHYRAARFMEHSLLELLVYGSMDSEFRLLLKNAYTDPLAQSALYMEDYEQITRYIHSWPEYKEIPHSSMYGYGTARAFAKLYGILANGGKMGERVLLSSATTPKLTEVLYSGVDLILGLNVIRGYAVLVSSSQSDKPSTVFGHPGYGGQMGSGDTAHGLGWAYLTNYPSASVGDKLPHYRALREAIYDSLDDD